MPGFVRGLPRLAAKPQRTDGGQRSVVNNVVCVDIPRIGLPRSAMPSWPFSFEEVVTYYGPSCGVDNKYRQSLAQYMAYIFVRCPLDTLRAFIPILGKGQDLARIVKRASPMIP